MSLQTISFNNKRHRSHSPDRMVTGEAEPARPMPLSIIKVVKQHGRINAAKMCQIKNINKSIETMDQDLLDGTIPKFLEYKFKKLYNKPDETAVRSNLLRLAINQEIALLKARKELLAAELDQRLINLTSEITPTLTTCNLNIEQNELAAELESTIQSFRVSFLLKQQADEKRKEEKRLKFLTYKEEQDTAVTITVKEVKGINIMIKKLQNQVKTLQLKKQGNVKGAASKSPRNTPSKPKSKSTGTGKGKGGKPKNTAKNKKSRGKNGKQ
jgi:hypothetical protein